jgi:hypothetical protein
MKRSLQLVVLLGLSALALPPAAGALVQIDKGIAGARLNNTKQEVRAALGKPRKVIQGMNDFGAFTQYQYRGKISVFFQSGNKVTSVVTRGLGDRARRGVGVGSKQSKADRLKGVKCERFFPGDPVHCHTGTFTAGARVTDFLIGANGRVKRITVGFVID